MFASILIRLQSFALTTAREAVISAFEGDASPVEAHAAQRAALFHYGDAQSELCRAEDRGTAPRSAPYDYDIIVGVAVGLGGGGKRCQRILPSYVDVFRSSPASSLCGPTYGARKAFQGSGHDLLRPIPALFGTRFGHAPAA